MPKSSGRAWQPITFTGSVDFVFVRLCVMRGIIGVCVCVWHAWRHRVKCSYHFVPPDTYIFLLSKQKQRGSFWSCSCYYCCCCCYCWLWLPVAVFVCTGRYRKLGVLCSILWRWLYVSCMFRYDPLNVMWMCCFCFSATKTQRYEQSIRIQTVCIVIISIYNIYLLSIPP